MESCGKNTKDKDGLWEALLDDRIDVIATDHAPHTWEEKQNVYTKCPSGAPLVQHSLVVMLENYKNGKISLERIVEKMAHNPAILFRIEKRGFIREGYKADLVLVDLNENWTVEKKISFINAVGARWKELSFILKLPILSSTEIWFMKTEKSMKKNSGSVCFLKWKNKLND
jgi:predicted amidohydrolase